MPPGKVPTTYKPSAPDAASSLEDLLVKDLKAWVLAKLAIKRAAAGPADRC